jgi:hypothetical protein
MSYGEPLVLLAILYVGHEYDIDRDYIVADIAKKIAMIAHATTVQIESSVQFSFIDPPN